MRALTKHKEWVELYMFAFMLVKISSIISSNTMSLNVDAIVSSGVIDSKKHVKLELVISSWVDPLYGTPQKIIFDKKTLPSKKKISNKYVDLCSKGPGPKHLKVGRDCEPYRHNHVR